MSSYIAGVMSIFKPLLQFGMKETQIEGLPILLELLDRPSPKPRGLITISNHISTLDDPIIWGIMPFSTFFNTEKVRWTLGASDILFTNQFLSFLFRNGQVIETFRGKGIYQQALDISISKLNDSQWVHIFPEGKVNQTLNNPKHQLLRFKWGVSRLVLESRAAPIIVPIWLKGFDKVMPEGRPVPQKFLPRLNQRVSIKVSPPIQAPLIEEFRTSYHSIQKSFNKSNTFFPKILMDHPEAKEIRIELASLLRKELLLTSF
ncbi:acyltransferase-domain-containing protein [Phakopsora pachyrhizi]|uniref:Tafazzin family protein n=1 Tax=Phakopsora pachyrhizi TaxID=170000 RepID=A0AAV0ASW1_PHAPC|nr:acyltransferase-domain-containing protein [Phakopsora pachyrhizi]